MGVSSCQCRFFFYRFNHTLFFFCLFYLQVVLCRLQMMENLLQQKAEEQGASEAVGDKLMSKAVTLMESMAALVDR